MPDDLILRYGELYNFFTIYHNVNNNRNKRTVNVVLLESPGIITPPPSQLSSMKKLISMKLVLKGDWDQAVIRGQNSF